MVIYMTKSAKLQTKTQIIKKNLKKYEITIEELDKAPLIEFKEEMKKLSDTRQQHKTTYKIWDIVVTSFIAILANQDSWNDIHDFVEIKYDFFKTLLKMSGGVASAKTYERVFSIIKPKELEGMCTYFVIKTLKLFNNKIDILSFDGKMDNSSSRNEKELRDSIKSLNVLNVYSDNYDMCLASEQIEDKTNEITAIPVILNRIHEG